jgi:hypothetical protein
MARRLCIFLLLLPTAVAGLTQVARAAPVSSCDNPSDSALSQYCETIPSTGGGQRPGTGTPALGSSLPAPIVRQIVAPAAGHQAGRHRRLLTIPAPAKKTDVAAAPVNQSAGTQGLSTWMIVILVLLALALASGALLDRRRRRAGPG